MGSETEVLSQRVTDFTEVTWFAFLQELRFGPSFPTGAFADVAEQCGGMAVTSKLLMRRKCLSD